MRMGDKRIAFLLLFFVIVLILEQAYLMLLIRPPEDIALSSNAMGEVKLCINHPPVFNNSNLFKSLRLSGK